MEGANNLFERAAKVVAERKAAAKELLKERERAGRIPLTGNSLVNTGKLSKKGKTEKKRAVAASPYKLNKTRRVAFKELHNVKEYHLESPEKKGRKRPRGTRVSRNVDPKEPNSPTTTADSAYVASQLGMLERELLQNNESAADDSTACDLFKLFALIDNSKYSPENAYNIKTKAIRTHKRNLKYGEMEMFETLADATYSIEKSKEND